MDPLRELAGSLSRRQFFSRSRLALGTTAAAMLLRGESTQASGLEDLPHFAPRAKRVIFLFQSGGPAQLDLFDYKPRLREFHGTELPDSVRKGQRLTEFTSKQKTKPVAASKFQFSQHGASGAWITELLPRTAAVADDLCIIRSVHTDAINHDPAITMVQTGSQQPGRPALGAWLSYGLGHENADLPTFVVLASKGSGRAEGEPLYTRLWGNGFLPSVHQGVRLRSAGDPVLYLSDPPGVDRRTRRHLLDDVAKLNRLNLEEFGDPEIATRIAQYELAFRMQTSAPELVDVSREPQSVFDLYGDDARNPGTFAANCLLARRLAERGVRCIQLFHRGWDQHGNLPQQITKQCGDIDQPTAGLLTDLKARGMLEDTLVVWGGEFGRTVYCQGKLTASNYGRDHHPRCFTMWMAGGGVRGGMTYGETDDYGYNVVKDPVAVHDLNATTLHLLGVKHTQLTYKFQGREHRLTDVYGNVLESILA
jgi:hypothetical protein